MPTVPWWGHTHDTPRAFHEGDRTLNKDDKPRKDDKPIEGELSVDDLEKVAGGAMPGKSAIRPASLPTASGETWP